jgi:hypothetical protein
VLTEILWPLRAKGVGVGSATSACVECIICIGVVSVYMQYMVYNCVYYCDKLCLLL